MKDTEKNKLLAQIISGVSRCKISGTLYIVRQPTATVKCEAEELVQEFLENGRFEQVYTLEQAKSIFVPSDMDTRMQALDKRQEDLLVEIYEGFEYPDLTTKLKKTLGQVREKITDNLHIIHDHDALTIEGAAASLRYQYLIAKSTFYEDGSPAWPMPFDKIDYLVLDRLIADMNTKFIEPTKIREIARTEPWKSYWYIKPDNIFGNDVFALTEEQRSLITYSKMYDNIGQHPEAPSDAIIADDDALDGWMITLKRERMQKKNDKQIDKILDGKHQNAKEVFMMTKRVDKHGREYEIDRKLIDDKNSPEARIRKAQREAAIAHQGKLTEAELPDVKIDRLNQRSVNGPPT